MPAAARGNGVDTVYSSSGTGSNYAFPTTTTTDQCSPDTLINGTGVVREDDKVASHRKTGGGIDESVITTFSSTVFVNGKAAARLGDKYTSPGQENTITSGSPTVFIGG